jgi:hypothetical protein
MLSDTLLSWGMVGSRQPEFQIALARGLVGTGDLTLALSTIGTVLKHAEENGECWYVPELLRVQCEILNAATGRRTISDDHLQAKASPYVLQAGTVIPATLDPECG